ncbi:MAG: diaminopropionate ammonia-lyase [Hyphomicrobiales bacterium]|nr:diaminopropionate ammonia-lyase [Hyphomicrobiales bacterium]
MFPFSGTAGFTLNPGRRNTAYGPTEQAILSRANGADAAAVICAWPGYEPTPLVPLPELARQLNVASINLKDESGRFGLGSFKALGGAYAVYRLFAGQIEEKTGTRPAPSDLVDGHYGHFTSARTVCCATDGNHGRAVAWGAQIFGCRCVIYVHETVSAERVGAIEAFGATVVRRPGNYDDAVRAAAADAKRNSWTVVSDTSYPGYTDIPRNVMQGYTVMVGEVLASIEAGHTERPTHVFIQGGVGGLAAAVSATLWETYGPDRPRLVVVEPDKAACLYESARAGEPVVVDGALDTIMAGLACGEPSLLAWSILMPGADAFMSVPDESALAAMRLLATGEAGARVVAGESGVGGLAGLLIAADRPDIGEALGLDRTSRVLVFSTEGDTDPGLYERIVGRSAEAVRSDA